MFDLGFRLKYSITLRILVTVEIYITSEIVSKCVFGTTLQLRYVFDYVVNCFRICNVMINVARVTLAAVLF